MWMRRFGERERGKRRVESGAEGFGRGREDKQKHMSWRYCKLFIKGLIDGKDGSVVVNLPKLGVKIVFILIELCFHCQGIFGLETYCHGYAITDKCILA